MASPERFTAPNSLLLVVDLQTKLLEKIEGRERLAAGAGRLLDAADALGIPRIATEQYPKGLGPSVKEVVDRLPVRPSKAAFGCGDVLEVRRAIEEHAVEKVTVVGIEAHVCVAQTALQLLELGLRVQVLADAVGSRHPVDREVALRRLESAGAVISTIEAALFEWIETADHPQFKLISQLVKQSDAARVDS